MARFTVKGMAVCLATLAIAGCASGPEPYRGVTGYRIWHKGDVTGVSYTLEANDTEGELHRLSLLACAKVLGVPRGQLALRGERVERRAVRADIPIPVVVGAGSGVASSACGEVPGFVHYTQAVVRTVDVKTLSAECTILPAASS